MRLVAFKKAILAGAAGALAWEALIDILIATGLPLFDLTRLLGTMAAGRSSFWIWWPLGMLMHVAVAAIWAIFYAYFFFYTFDGPPVLQGMVFSLGPMVLAGLIMLPQMAMMHPLILSGEATAPGMFAIRTGWGGPVSLAIGHLAYGAVMGALYTHPSGFPAGRVAAHV